MKNRVVADEEGPTDRSCAVEDACELANTAQQPQIAAEIRCCPQKELNAVRNRLDSGSDESLKWEEFFGGPLEIAPSLLNMYDKMVAKNGLVIGEDAKKNDLQYRHKKKCQGSQKIQRLKISSGYIVNEKKRPASISSTCSSGSSASSVTSLPPNCSFTMDNKKVPYLTSIESFDDEFSDEEEIRDTSKRDKLKSGQLISCNSISAPKPCLGRPKYWDPNLSYIDRVVMEIFETEKTYVSDLLQIITGYMQPITSRADLKISETHISDLFGNIEDIYKFNSEFLKGLEQCGLDPVKVAQCFVEHNEGFSIYTNYCTNYPRTVSVLTEVMRKEESAAIFKDRQASLEHTLPLGSYLLKPVQRILKYHLLLQNMVKHYEKGKDGASDIKKALCTMTGIASHINDMKRKHEHAVRVQEIQSLLYGWIGQDLTTYGELVAEGMFRVYGAKALRHVFLFDKMLLIAKKKEDGTMSYKTHILCSNLMLIESVPGEPLSFHVIPFDNPKFMYTLQARTVEQKREWSLQLKRVILENYNAVIPSHARQLVMELGQSKDEDGALLEKPSSKKQHSAPEYLEKRKQERRKSETGLNKALRIKKGVKKLDPRSPKGSPGPLRHNQRIQTKSKARASSLNRMFNESSDPVLEDSQDIDSSMEDNDVKSSRRKSEPGYYSSRESLSLVPTNVSVNSDVRRESEDDGLSSDNLGDYEMLTFPQSRPSRRQASSEDEDPAGDYVTFDFAQRCLSRDCASPSPAEYYRYYSKLANYDNLAHIWSELGTVDVDQLDLDSEAEGYAEASERRPSSVRRVQSFSNPACGVSENEPTFQHSYSMRQSKKIGLHLNTSGVSSRPPSGMDIANSPTAPIVWLKKQGEHLAEGTNKCGSLPRSFLVNQDDDQFNKTASARIRSENKLSECRPVTIASDKPEKTDFLDDFERYIKNTPLSQKRRSNKFPVSQEDCDDQQSLSGWTECADSASASNEALYPEYKIYRQTTSRSSIRSVLANVSSKLTSGIKNTIIGASKMTNGDQTRSCSNISLQSCDGASTPISASHRLSTYSNSSFQEDDNMSVQSKTSTSTRTSAKLVYNIAKAYGTMLKHRLKKAAEAASTEKLDASPPVANGKTKTAGMYRQGSEAIGARIANQAELDYCAVDTSRLETPKTISAKTSNVITQQSSLRPDSLLSEASNLTSSSNESDRPKAPETTAITNGQNAEEGDISDDSYYERSFEAIERLLENEMFRDSAIYSDQEDSDNANGQEVVTEDKASKPAVPCKPQYLASRNSSINELVNVKKVKGNAILEVLENLQKNTAFQKEDSPGRDISGIKSIVERRKELEEWQQSVMSQTNESEDASETTPTPDDQADGNVRMKGWVKHLVGKFQSDS